MNYWFVIHDLLAYSQHSDMIGNVVKGPGIKQPKFHSFCDIEKVDIVADEGLLKQIQELLERVADPNIVKSRVRFYSFKDFLT